MANGNKKLNKKQFEEKDYENVQGIIWLQCRCAA